MKAEEIIKSFSGGDVTLTEAQTKSLKAEFCSMQAIVDEYKAQLKKNAVRCCAEALPQLCGDELEGILNALTPHQLKSFSEALVQKKAVKAQLANEKSKKQSDNTEFVI